MRQLIVGNWKMNLTANSAEVLLEGIETSENVDVLVCPPYPYLALAKKVLKGRGISLGGQDCHWAESGAYTGDVSAGMLKDVGCTHVILGHSERRQGHQESSATVQAKAATALGHGLVAIVCIGETDAQNQAGETQMVLEKQLIESIPKEIPTQQLVIAYEPVWAIGTGRTATADEIVETHHFIREKLKGICKDGDSVPLLYGGSVNAKNAGEILSLPNVNGVLVGGASLKVDDFNQIIRASRAQ